MRPLIHGATYFAELHDRVSQMRDGDLLMFVDWRGDPDERLAGTPDTEVGRVFADAARRDVDVRGLLWRSHWDRLAFSAGENRHLGEEINAAGGQCRLDMRVRTGGSHHQKFVVLRHHDRPELDVAFLGGIDLCHGRCDDASHGGDPQRQPMAAVYGPRPPWHDVQLAISGPAVGDVETVFRERWDDAQSLRLLRLVVEEVRVTGWNVEIQLHIPLDDEPDNMPPTEPRDNGPISVVQRRPSAFHWWSPAGSPTGCARPNRPGRTPEKELINRKGVGTLSRPPGDFNVCY